MATTRIPVYLYADDPISHAGIAGQLRPRPEVRDVRVDVAGELCTPRDVLSRDQPVSRLRIGDVLVFGRAGAYGWDISHHDFLRHPPPTFEVL